MKMKRMERYINHWGCISTPEEVIQIGCLSVKLSSISFFMHHETDICAICHLTKVSTMTGENMYGDIDVVSLANMQVIDGSVKSMMD